MADRRSPPDHPPLQTIRQLETLLSRLHSRATALQKSGLRELDIHSVEVLRQYSETGLTILRGMLHGLDEGEAEDALERATELAAFLGEERDHGGLLRDLPQAQTDARNEADALPAGQKRTAALKLIRTIPSIIRDLTAAPALAERVQDDVRVWRDAQTTKETPMPSNENEFGGIAAILQDISRQIGFIGARSSGQTVGTTAGAGSFRNVGAQLTASLDALSLPREGVQFTGEGRSIAAADMLIDGLMDNYRQETRNGLTVFVPGRTEGRAPSRSLPVDVLAGASRVAARLVRSEGDVILDILDRLPDMTRFELRAGVPSLRSVRDRVAVQFDDLDEVMGDPLGVNLPQALSVISRAIKATLDFVDYANLEGELSDQFERVDLGRMLGGRRAETNDDEVSLRRSVAQSEELRSEIRELAEAYKRLCGYVSRPLSDTLGRSAARLDRQLSAINRSALDLRATLDRFGTSQAEQDLIMIIENMSVRVKYPSGGDEADFEMSVGQLLGWIIKTSADSRGQSGRITALETPDLVILSKELAAQSKALGLLAKDEGLHRFALGLGSVKRQIEELQALVDGAAANAATLAGR
ncbi:hypothetical protein [Salipiger mangrovisoli]|uniref:Uncharacterized protein n=1 Tax=Salipiger mangrovisoli TaxID=2865933 RepID=A0ABR9X166_9RHOB|nr:hypothetical protein [Salipiger mangrovisoli]MBE9637266.1 hypothetical protein [Salipiger mangrovisoli]